MTIKKGYTKRFVTKILRVKHIIAFDCNTRKIDLMNMLRDVPDEATVNEVIDDNIDGIITIEFHEERVVEKFDEKQ